MRKDIRYNLTAQQHVLVAMEHLNANHKPVLMMGRSLHATHMVILTTGHLMVITTSSKAPVNMFSPHHVILWSLLLQSVTEHTMNMYLVQTL